MLFISDQCGEGEKETVTQMLTALRDTIVCGEDNCKAFNPLAFSEAVVVFQL